MKKFNFKLLKFLVKGKTHKVKYMHKKATFMGPEKKGGGGNKIEGLVFIFKNNLNIK